MDFTEPDLVATFLGTGHTPHDLGMIQKTNGVDRYGEDGLLQLPGSIGLHAGLNHLACELESEADLVAAFKRVRHDGVATDITVDHRVALPRENNGFTNNVMQAVSSSSGNGDYSPELRQFFQARVAGCIGGMPRHPGGTERHAGQPRPHGFRRLCDERAPGAQRTLQRRCRPAVQRLDAVVGEGLILHAAFAKRKFEQPLFGMTDIEPAPPTLLAALSDASPDVRKEAVLALGSHMTNDALAAVTRCLHHDPAPEVRACAVLALEQSKPEGAIDDLIQALDDESPVVRSAVACALGEHQTSETPAIVTALVRALSDASAGVRESAARALRYSSAEAVPALVALLADQAADVRKEAIGALGTLDAWQAVDALAELLRSDSDAEVRGGAASALGNLRHAGATAHLIDAFNDELTSSEVRSEIVRALGNTQDFAALPTLCVALQDADAETREAAAQGLDALVDPEVPDSSLALEPLCAALKDTECSVREAARSGLGSLKDPRALPFLIQAAQDDKEVPLETALEAIARIDPIAGEKLLLEGLAHSDTDVQRTAARFLVLPKDGPIPPEVLACLAAPDGDPFAKCDLAKALARRGGADALPVLIGLVQDRSGRVRAAAAQALGERPDPRAMTPLLALLGDDDEDVRGEAALALAALADDRAIAPLAALLDDGWAPVRRRAVWALSFLTPSKVLSHLVASLEDNDPHVRSTAVSALADVCDAKALRRIRSALLPAFEDVGSALEEAAADLEDEAPSRHDGPPRRVQLGTLHYE
ncbi:HEAT repeat domain-containing protein [Variovorax sp. RCC_210]|uniref:HEAT repeat domain-containing protein n=1 Tax=Variovorax sp. RCC_210 TaxID=3239217 RepID=UPI003525FFB1